jgi:hypothetical protein
MNRLLILILTLTTIGCSEKNESIEITKYNYPTDKLGDGKIFVYRNPQTLNQTYTENRIIEENGDKFILSKQYSDKEKWDSTKWIINGNKIKLLETYWFYVSDSLDKNAELIKGEILRQEQLDNGDALELRYKLPTNIYNTIKTKDQFVKDTVLVWDGQQIECKKYIGQIEMETEHIWIPFIGRESKSVVTKYYGKNLGLIKYTTDTRNGQTEWELIEVR